MKPSNVIDMHRTGDLGGQKVGMKIDENSIAHIMTLLTDLYSDPELAVLREYSTNARDSHVMAGQTKPIEVILPNNMNPYIKIRDFGLGLSVADVENVYSKYGASTKRESDEVNGMLGLGCKSALTYTSQFTITSVKDGRKAIVVVSRVEDGTGVMEIVSESDTTEPNGVEVSIPVKTGNRFARKAVEFFRFWPEGSVLVNGEPVKRIKGQEITPNTMAVTDEGLESDIIVMGGVSYPVPGNGLYTGHRPYYNSFKVVAFVEMGPDGVNFTPSREALSMTAKTKATIARITAEFKAALHAKVRSDIDAQVDHPTALAKFIEWTNLLANGMPQNVTYKGQTIPTQWKDEFQTWHVNRGRYSLTRSTYIDHDTLSKAVIVTDYDDKQITPRHKQKMKAWAAEQGLSPSQFVFCKTRPGLPWVNGKGVVSWTTILAYKLPSVARQAKIPTFDTYSNGSFAEVEADDIDKTKPVYYISPRDKKHPSVLRALTKMLGDATIVVLGENRLAKFQREFPKALPLTPAVQSMLNASRDALTKNDLMNMSVDYYDKQMLTALDETVILDPTVRDAIKVAKGLTTSATQTKYAEVTKVAQQYGIYVPNTGSGGSAFANYPLIQNRGRSDIRHATIYINAVFTATQNGAI